MSEDEGEERVLRAVRVVSNRHAWVGGTLPYDEFVKLLNQEAHETPGGWPQLASTVAGLADMAIGMVARAIDVSFDDALAMIRQQ